MTSPPTKDVDAALLSSWRELHLCATSEKDVAQWFVANGRLLIRKAHALAAAQKIEGLTLKPSGDIRSAGFVRMLHKSFTADSFDGPILTLYMQMHAPERHYLAELLNEMGVIAERRSHDFLDDGFTRAISIGFDAREWRFAASYMLQKNVELPARRGKRARRTEVMQSILSAQFPNLTLTAYTSTAPSILGLIDSDPAMFRTWLDQYVPAVPLAPTLDLPADMLLP